MGSFLEPIISAIANALIKGVKYINIFITALTGVDLLSKAISKSMKKSTNSTKELSKTLAGFDELSNLETQSNFSTNEVNTSWVDAFNNVVVEENIAKTIEDIGERIKNAFTWITENWKTIVFIIGIVVIALTSIYLTLQKQGKKDINFGLSNLFTKLGTATGIVAILGGLSIAIREFSGLISEFSESGLSLGNVAILLGTVLGELALAFVVIAGATKTMNWEAVAGAAVILIGFALVINEVSNLLKVFSENGMTVGNVALLMTTIFGTLITLMGAIALLGPVMTNGLIPFSVVVALISALLIVTAETIPIILEACSKFITNTAPSIISILDTIGNTITNIIYALGTTWPPIINSVGGLFEKIFNGISIVVQTVGNIIVSILKTAESLITNVLNSILNFINRLGPAINNFTDNTILAVTKLINFIISGIEYLVNTVVVGGVNKIIKAINSISEYVGITIPTVSNNMTIPRFVPKLALGTNYVPEDQLAYIHKGEAVIPKKFNSQEYFGTGNEKTNSLLEQAIEAINNIEVNPYTTIKDVGQASVSYVRAKQRQTGRSVFA